MKRTQIYLPLQLYSSLTQEADALQLSVSEVIRRFLSHTFASRSMVPSHRLLQGLVALGKGTKRAPSTVSQSYKSLLYGRR